MLTEIHIRDFALIDKLDLDFHQGFSVLTGETGAGKSIIIDAISAALGERLPSDIIRTGSDKAVVEAVFDLSDAPHIRQQAAEAEVEIEDDTLFLSRELTRSGKSQCRINGRLCTLSMLKQVTRDLLDLHGQHEHQSLLSTESHLEVFDVWLGARAAALRNEMADAYLSLSRVHKQIEQLRTDQRERAHLLDLYKFQQQEIESANLSVEEEDVLQTDRARLSNAEKLFTLASSVRDALDGDSLGTGGSLSEIAQAARAAEQMAALDPSASQMSQMLQNALFAAEEAQTLVRDYRDGIEFSPERLEAVEERFDLIRNLKRKYGDNIEQILEYSQDISGKISDLENSEERTQELELEAAKLEAETARIASELSGLRRSRSEEFASEVMRELSHLAMEKTRFSVSIEPSELSARGADHVEFLISPNPGEPLKPLAKIASGGEMSRIMLALKSVMAAADRVPTLIFDEVDSGIGGRTANVVGDKLAAVAGDRQVMCVTHLPQIASRASWHLSVEKITEGERTVVRVRCIESDDRVRELARMLGSDESADTAIQHAREMLGSAAT